MSSESLCLFFLSSDLFLLAVLFSFLRSTLAFCLIFFLTSVWTSLKNFFVLFLPLPTTYSEIFSFPISGFRLAMDSFRAGYSVIDRLVAGSWIVHGFDPRFAYIFYLFLTISWRSDTLPNIEGFIRAFWAAVDIPRFPNLCFLGFFD